MKISKNSVIKTLFICSVILVHFDPTRQKLTIVLLFMPLFILFYTRMAFKSYLPFILLGLSIIYPFVNYLTFTGFAYSFFEFSKTYVLYVTSVFIHVSVIYFSLKREQFDFSKYIIPSLMLLLFITSLQFFGYLLFKTTIFYNVFGRFQYNSIAIVEEFVAGALPRTQAFYLEPSYLAFVTISLVSVNLLYRWKEKFTLLIGGAIVIMSGSRGGYFGFFLLILWYLLYNFKNVKVHFKMLYFLLFVSLIPAFILLSPILSLFSSDSLSTENTSQYVRFYSGFQLSGYVLNNFYLGIPLGTIELSFSNFLKEENTSYSFFFFNIFYHGWMSIFVLIFIGWAIYLNSSSARNKALLIIYVLLYFNMTGSIIAPDTYFWFFCFYYVYRVCSANDKLHIGRPIIQ